MRLRLMALVRSTLRGQLFYGLNSHFLFYHFEINQNKVHQFDRFEYNFKVMNRLSDTATSYGSPRQKRLKLNEFSLFHEKLIGKGAFSSVYLCKDEHNNWAACKVINKSSNKGSNALQVAQSEVTIIKNLKHSSIVRYLGSFESSNNFYILIRYYQGLTLRQILNKAIKLPILEIINITVQMIGALQYLHSKKIVHRDIKPDNIKYTHQNVVLLDFGFATTVKDMENSQLSECLGSAPYMCPEIMRKQRYTSRSEIWSFGVVIYELIYGCAPWKGRDQHQLLKNISTNQIVFPPYPVIPNKLKQLIEGCLRIDPLQRFSWEKVFSYANLKYLSEGYVRKRSSNVGDSFFNCMNLCE